MFFDTLNEWSEDVEDSLANLFKGDVWNLGTWE